MKTQKGNISNIMYSSLFLSRFFFNCAGSVLSLQVVKNTFILYFYHCWFKNFIHERLFHRIKIGESNVPIGKSCHSVAVLGKLL